MNFKELFHQFKNIKVGVLGDVMLDTYWWGNVDRISPEAPVPVVALQKQELRLGGAGNVAINLAALGANVSTIGVVGNDDAATQLRQLLIAENINANYLVVDENRPTTNKTRILSKNQQMLRLDAETTNDVDAIVEDNLFQNLEQYLQTEKPQVIILQDYNKGVLTSSLIKKTIELCKQYNVFTTVDPKKKNFFAYKGVTIFKPNLKEVKEGLNIALSTINQDTLAQVHTQLQQQLQHHISFITLSEKGVFYNTQNQSQIIPTHVRNIADVSGAGDTVISVASLVYAATQNMHLAAEIANIAGGLVCEEVGTAPINAQKLLIECERLLQ
jgi:rfaE bifunctional protein kinase chain/domain